MPWRRPWRWASVPAVTVALALFAWLADEILHGKNLAWDPVVRNTVHSWASPPLTLSLEVLTLLGSSVFLIAMSLLLGWRLARASRKQAAVFLITAVIGALVLDELLKLAFHRHRPMAFFGYRDPASYSFPSGHAFSSSCFYGILAAIVAARMESRLRKAAVWAAAALVSLLIGFSRIYLGVHYPSDVAAGYAAAVIWLAALRVLIAAWQRGG